MNGLIESGPYLWAGLLTLPIRIGSGLTENVVWHILCSVHNIPYGESSMARPDVRPDAEHRRRLEKLAEKRGDSIDDAYESIVQDAGAPQICG